MKWQDGLTISLLATILLTGLIGNSLVIYVYGFMSKKRFVKFEKLMLILGIVDLLATIVNTIMYLYLTIHGHPNWVFGTIGCKVMPAIGPILSYISLGIILILTIDRDRAICAPLRKQFDLNMIYGAIAVNSIFSILTILPYSYYSNVTKDNGTCRMDYNIYSLLLNVIIFITIDTIFISIFIVTLMRIIWNTRKSQVHAVAHTNDRNVSNNNQNHRKNKLKARQKRERNYMVRICLTIFAMACVFIICVFPRDIYLTVYYIRQLSPPNPLKNSYEFTLSIVKIFHTANSSVNVFIYSIVNLEFRKDMKKLLRKFIGKIYPLGEGQMELNSSSLNTNENATAKT